MLWLSLLKLSAEIVNFAYFYVTRHLERNIFFYLSTTQLWFMLRNVAFFGVDISKLIHIHQTPIGSQNKSSSTSTRQQNEITPEHTHSPHRHTRMSTDRILHNSTIPKNNLSVKSRRRKITVKWIWAVPFQVFFFCFFIFSMGFCFTSTTDYW